jgi:hypothetical protein
MPVDFPTNAEGKRSTASTAKSVLAASVASVDPDLAAACLAEKDWRWQYWKHLFSNNLKCASSPSTCLTVAREGLAAAHRQFHFFDGDTAVPLHTAMAEVSTTSASFGSGVIHGNSCNKQPTFQVPFRGDILHGSKLAAQCSKWREAGVMEPSADAALQGLMNDKSKQEWANLTGRHFVILGAGSQMGPTNTLLQLGATVHAVDIPNKMVWEKLIKTTRESSGTLVFPIVSAESGTERLFETEAELEDASQLAGVSVMDQPKELATWISTQAPSEPITIGCYTYLDGAKFARVAIACDAVEAAVCRLRPGLVRRCIPDGLLTCCVDCAPSEGGVPRETQQVSGCPSAGSIDPDPYIF